MLWAIGAWLASGLIGGLWAKRKGHIYGDSLPEAQVHPEVAEQESKLMRFPGCNSTVFIHASTCPHCAQVRLPGEPQLQEQPVPIELKVNARVVVTTIPGSSCNYLEEYAQFSAHVEITNMVTGNRDTRSLSRTGTFVLDPGSGENMPFYTIDAAFNGPVKRELLQFLADLHSIGYDVAQISSHIRNHGFDGQIYNPNEGTYDVIIYQVQVFPR